MIGGLLLFATLFILFVPSVVCVLQGTSRTDAAKAAKARADLHALDNASIGFRADFGRWPANLAELETPGSSPDGRTRQYLNSQPHDPWSGELYPIRRLPDGTPEFYSLGRDGAPGGEGLDADIVIEREQDPRG